MIRALYGAIFTCGRITRLVIEETGRDVEAFDDFYERQLKILRHLAPSRRHLIQRNDQCPCASGRKYGLSSFARKSLLRPIGRMATKPAAWRRRTSLATV